jgi:hypothetical protein
MTRRRSRTRKLSQRPKSRPDPTTSVLKEMVRTQEIQQRGTLPAVPDIPRMMIKSDAVYTTQLSYLGAVLTQSTTLDIKQPYSFSFNSIANNTAWSNVFDEYRVIQISAEFVPNSTASTSSPFYSVIDTDDANIPTNLATLLGYSSLQLTEGGQIHRRVFCPRIAVAAYTGGSFTGFANQSPYVWIDTTLPTVVYYGLKTYWPLNAVGGATLQPTFRLIVQFRKARNI